MKDAREQSRLAVCLPLDLYRGDEATRGRCHTRDIGMGGLFAAGCKASTVGERLRVAIGGPNGSALHLNAEVVRIEPDGVALAFVDNSPATLEVLRALLQPAWDDRDVLGDVVHAGRWQGANDPGGWTRLTSIVAEMRHRQGPRPD